MVPAPLVLGSQPCHKGAMPRRPTPAPRPDAFPTTPESRYHIARYQRTRHWGVYDGQILVVVTVYKRGAAEVVQRLQALEQQVTVSTLPDHGPVWRPSQPLPLWADDGTSSPAP